MSDPIIETIRDGIQAVTYDVSRSSRICELVESKAELSRAIVDGRRRRPSVVTEELAVEMGVAVDRLHSPGVWTEELAKQLETLRRASETLRVRAMTEPKPTLGETDVAILSELLELDATTDAPQTRETIATRLRWEGDGKRAFDPLKKLGYVESCRHGYYLTEAGRERAKRLS